MTLNLYRRAHWWLKQAEMYRQMHQALRDPFYRRMMRTASLQWRFLMKEMGFK